MHTVHVCLADDHRAFAQALAARLRTEPCIEMGGIASDRAASLRLIGAERPDILVLDLALGEDNGVELLPELLDVQPSLRAVMLSGYGDPDLVVAAVRAGARAWVIKTAGGVDLVSAIRTVAAGGAWFPPLLLMQVLDRLVHPPDQSPEARLASTLTGREHEVLQYLVDGVPRKRIAEELRLSENTVRVHIQNLLSKLNTHSRAEAVAIALRLGMRPAYHRAEASRSR
jgi:DNA-binding NarL/FixJ family response regulator